jgi:hypothetical protein
MKNATFWVLSSFWLGLFFDELFAVGGFVGGYDLVG